MSFFSKLESKGICYNNNQKKAITYTEGPLLVAAGPGSGKTSVITARTAYLTLTSCINKSNVLVITFTRAAADEMKSRFLSFPGITSKASIKADFGTFHSTFYKIINTYYGRHIPVLEHNKIAAIIKNILRSLDEPYDQDRIQNTLNEISISRTLYNKPDEFRSQYFPNSKFLYIYQQYDKQKKLIKGIDFDDMMIICKNILESQKNILDYYRQKYKYFLIDEFQDTSKMQFDIIRLLCWPHNNICVVGDDDQSIYGFRGVMADCLTNFEHYFASCQSIVLDVNYRSTDEIVNLSQKIISHNILRKEKYIKSNNTGGEMPKIVFPENENIEASLIIDQIESMNRSGHSFNDLAVLYRVNMQARPIIDELIKRDIPFNVKDSLNNFFEHWICRDITCYLKLSADNVDIPSLTSIINRPVRYVSRACVDKAISNYKSGTLNIVKAFTDCNLNDYQKEQITNLFNSLKMLRYLIPSSAVNFIRKSISYDDYIKNYCLESNISQEDFFNILDEYEMAATGFKTISEFLSHIYEVSIKIKKDVQTIKKYKSNSVTLSTIHSSKGLEFYCVCVIGAIEGFIPHAKSLIMDNYIEEERRLFYVAVTRAKQNVIISSPINYHGKAAKISRFIEEVSQSVIHM